jgi:UDP-3-O-[3-hydroxymyristoyl] glucosamine N-acyltransferase
VTVGAGAVLRDCVIAAQARIGASAEIGAGVVLETGAVVPDRAKLV